MTGSSAPKSVVVGLDGTERSEPAVRAAIDLARRFRTRPEFVHAVEIPPATWVLGQPAEIATVNAEYLSAAWTHQREHLAKLFAADGFDTFPVDDVLHVLPGPPTKVLIERADELSCDWILLGAHAKHGLIDFGGNMRAVLAQTHGNVWFQPCAYKPPQKILVPVDLSEDSLLALTVARQFASGFEASVTALHCFLPPEFAYAPTMGYPATGPTYVVDDARKAAREEFERVMAAYDWGKTPHDLLFQEGRPVETILEHAAEFDMLAMGSHGRTGLSRAVLGNVAYGVLKKAKVPVLAIRHPERQWLL